MNLFSRAFRKHKVEPVVLPPDGHLKERLKIAKRENSRVVNRFIEASQKQERDAEFARFVIQDVLDRAENMKVVNHEGTQE